MASSFCRHRRAAMSGASRAERVLRLATSQDMALIAELRSDLALQHMLMAHPASQPAKHPIEDAFAWVKKREAAGFFRIVAAADHTALGFVQIFDIHHKNRLGWISIALTPKARGAGMGAAGLTALEQAAISDLGLRKLLLQVRADNGTAISLYDRAKWRRAGCLVDHYDDGASCHDVLIYEKILSLT